MTMPDVRELTGRIRQLEQQLAEAEDTLRALRDGEVDAVVTEGPDGHRVFTLKGADEPYRVLIQQMADGAVTLSPDGLILFSNQQFADTVASPLERVIGSRVFEFFDPTCLQTARALIANADRSHAKGEILLRKADGRVIPAYMSVKRLQVEGLDGFCMMVTDLTEQKRNEEIVVAEKLARSILEQAAEAILVVDLEGRIIRASRAADRLAGSGVLLKTLHEVFQIRTPGGLPVDYKAMLAMANHGGGSEPLEMTAETAAGVQMYVLLSVAPLGGFNGASLGCIIHLTDITQRKRIEQTLHESQEVYRNMADAMPQIVYVNGPDGACEFVNRQWKEFTGDWSGLEALNLTWLTRIHPEDRTQTLERWSQCIESGDAFEAEYRLRRHDDQYRWHLSRAIPVKDEEGRLLRWIGTSTDVDDFKITEARLRDSENRLRTMAETVPEILFTTLPDGYCDYASTRVYEFTGLPAGSIDGFGWLNAIHPEDRQRVHEDWNRSAANGEPFSVEYRMRRADSTYRWMQVRAQPMRGPAGEVVKWFGVCADIDEHKRLEESLQRRSVELARSNEELQRFAYAASHDLQEPLRTIGSMSKLLSRRCAPKLDGEDRQLLDQIDTGVVRMTTLIRDLLDYSRVSAEGSVAPKAVDCEGLLSFALMNVQAKIALTGATVHRGPMPMVMADEQLVRVFQNLIGNALKYRSEKPAEIYINATRENSECIFSVRDNGIGIDMRYADRIFDVFQRLHTRSHYEGTGIGLAICRKIVERYGGRIWVESAPGAGSTFFFSLPAAE